MTAEPDAWVPPARLVEEVRRALAAVRATSPEQRFERLAWTALLATTGPGLLTRHAAPCHVTASAAVLSPDGARTCLVLHRKLRAWVQPGGHLERGDVSPAAAAAREVQEETGLVGRVLPVPVLLGRHRAPCAPGVVDWHLDVQHLVVAGEAAPSPSDETPQVAWWPVDALPEPLVPGVRELVKAAAGRQDEVARGAR